MNIKADLNEENQILLKLRFLVLHVYCALTFCVEIMGMLLLYTITDDEAQFHAKIKTTANNTCTNNLAKPETLPVKKQT